MPLNQSFFISSCGIILQQMNYFLFQWLLVEALQTKLSPQHQGVVEKSGMASKLYLLLDF